MIENQLKLLLGWVLLVGLNRYCVQVPFSSPEVELNTRFASSNSTLNKGKAKFYEVKLIAAE